MMTRCSPIAAWIVALTVPVFAQEKKIMRSALPPAVEKAVQSETKEATIKVFAEEREHGKIFYEVETVIDGHTRDILFTSDGKIAEVEEEVAFDSLPLTVQTGLSKKASGFAVEKVEALSKNGRLVAYEGTIRRQGKPAEIKIGPQGQKLAHEE